MYITFLRPAPSYLGHSHISPSASAHKLTASSCKGVDVGASEDDAPPGVASPPPGAAAEPLISPAPVSSLS